MSTTDNGELCIWGLGLIGYSLAGALARAGRRCVVMDVDAERVARLNRGERPFHHLPNLPDDFGAETRRGALRATTDVLCTWLERDTGAWPRLMSRRPVL
ncbi:hypothetical protein J7E95_41615 [Streptomyces sp. ISL-14]|nr:hypothetical protein [Streptomyces sp. ISL-14]